jgi:hypothetical protein
VENLVEFHLIDPVDHGSAFAAPRKRGHTMDAFDWLELPSMAVSP